MLVYITNRTLKKPPKDSIKENTIKDIEGDLNTEINPFGDAIYCGIANDDHTKITFYPRGKELGLFDSIKKSEYNKPWIVLLHGYHQDVDETIKKVKFLEGYNINVVLFSWPSRPNPIESFDTDSLKDFIKDYVKSILFGFGSPSLQLVFLKELSNLLRDYIENYTPARKNARASTTDFHSTLSILDEHLFPRVKDSRTSFMVHSMGNYLLEQTLLDKGSLPVEFANVILHQADVTAANHATWVPKLLNNTRKRLYVTVNIFDYVLAASNILNRFKTGSIVERLGQSVRIKSEGQYLGYIKNKIHYLDFTDGLGVDTTHEIFTCKAIDINDVFISADKNHIDKSITNLLEKIFKSAKNDGLPNIKGKSKGGMSKMDTIPNIYKPEWIVEDESLCDESQNICFIDSIGQFEDPFQPEPTFDPELEDD